jgi:chorismate-pyruvate lyase
MEEAKPVEIWEMIRMVAPHPINALKLGFIRRTNMSREGHVLLLVQILFLLETKLLTT